MRQGIPNPNPQQQFITDLIKQITQWRQQDKEILISMDANEDVDNPKSKISSIFTEMDLVDLHNYCHPAASKPAMYQRGSQPIDLMLSTPLFAAALMAVWMLPFSEPPLIKGDHQLLGTDFHPGILFGSTPHNLASSLIRGINSCHEQHVLQFCQDVIKKCNDKRVDERIKDLFAVSHFDDVAIAELENIDQTLTNILVKVDQHLHPLSLIPWSPAVQQAYLLHHFWTLTCMAKQTEHNLSDAIKRDHDHLDPNLIDTDPNTSLSTKLQ